MQDFSTSQADTSGGGAFSSSTNIGCGATSEMSDSAWCQSNSPFTGVGAGLADGSVCATPPIARPISPRAAAFPGSRCSAAAQWLTAASCWPSPRSSSARCTRSVTSSGAASTARESESMSGFPRSVTPVRLRGPSVTEEPDPAEHRPEEQRGTTHDEQGQREGGRRHGGGEEQQAGEQQAYPPDRRQPLPAGEAAQEPQAHVGGHLRPKLPGDPAQ